MFYRDYDGIVWLEFYVLLGLLPLMTLGIVERQA